MTSKDLQEYIGVIEKMKNLINSAEFDQVFSLMTSDLSKSRQFLLKMELKRMAQPCDYFIDLRGKVSAEARPYVHKEKTHYMDDNAIKIFENGLKQYGQYTVGLYEEVMNTDNNYRVMHRRDTEQRIQAALDAEEQNVAADLTVSETQQARLLQFNQYHSRNEERMNFSIEVEVWSQQQRFNAVTADLSVSGCKLKVPAHLTEAIGTTLYICFTGLEQEYVLDTRSGISYQLVGITAAEKFNYWQLKRTETDENQEFNGFLKSFIHGNKRRYKVNLENTADAVLIKGYEQFYLPRISSLPVFLAVRDGYAVPVCALTTDANKAIWHYFQDEQQQAVFISIFSGRRLKSLLKKENEHSVILYCFTHAAKGKLYFYSATADELAASAELRQLYFGFGATKQSWRVFHFNLYRTSARHSSSLYSAPGLSNHKEHHYQHQPSALIQGFIQDVRYIATLTDITTDNATFWYQNYAYDTAQLKQLAVFNHKKLQQYPACEAIPVQYVNLRSEARYLYKTSVNIHHNREVITAFSRDFSSRGLQIETTTPVSFSKGDIVYLSLPDMQKISSRFFLQELPYEIVAVSKSRTIMNLVAAEGDEPHNGRQFFQQIIQNNRSKLTPAEETPKYPGLATTLRNMYVAALNNFVFYLHRKGIRYELDVAAQGKTSNALHTLLQQGKDRLDVTPLLKNNLASLQFAAALKKMKRFDLPANYELYLRLPYGDKLKTTDIISFYDFEFHSEQEKQAFVADTLQQQQLFFCFKLFLSRTGRPDIDYIAKELNYISVYALHKAKAIEEELWAVAGLGDMVNITEEVLQRFDLTATSVRVISDQ